MRHLLTALTGRDNVSLDIGRVLWALSTLVFLGLAVFSVARGTPFDAMALAGGLSTLSVGHGASLMMKSGTEPECK